MSVTVVGSANLDIVYRVERIPHGGETVLASASTRNPGGKGNNQAVAAARAGADVTFVAALGSDDAAQLLVDTLDSCGATSMVRRIDAATGTALITVDDGGENAIVVDQGANAHLVELTADEKRAVSAADYLLLQLETPLATVTQAARVAREAGTPVVLNAAPITELPGELLALVDVLIVNEHEAAELARQLGGEMPTGDLTVDAARSLAVTLTEQVGAVVVTLGGAGALVLPSHDADAAHVPARRVTAVDTTGAGDTFCGALVAALDDGRELVDAAGFATAAAGLSVQSHGAVPSIPERDAILAAL
jgi:ribokinase